MSAIVVSYVAIGWNDLPFDALVRADAPGEFATLTDGSIHYRWVEPLPGKDHGETIVMSHGFGVPGFMFEQIATVLASAGHKVLLFDHFGHGYSDRPRGSYDADFFAREVAEVLDAQQIEVPVVLLGQSMGGLIVTDFASRQPSRVKRLILIVPAGLRMYEGDQKFLTEMLATPVVGEWIWRVFGRAALSAPFELPCDICGDGKLAGDPYVQARYAGYFESMLNIMRHFPMDKQDHIYQQLARTRLPVLALFGEQDDLVKPASAALLETLVPDAKVIVLQHGDHMLHVRHAREVGNILLEWLAAQNAVNLSPVVLSEGIPAETLRSSSRPRA